MAWKEVSVEELAKSLGVNASEVREKGVTPEFAKALIKTVCKPICQSAVTYCGEVEKVFLPFLLESQKVSPTCEETLILIGPESQEITD